MKNVRSRVIAAFVLFFIAGYASASFTMSMSITPPSFQKSQKSAIGIELTNRGDENAYKGIAAIKYPDSLKADPIFFEKMAPNTPGKKTENVTAKSKMLPGTYPLVVSLQFHDQNNYPIYMIFDSSFVVEKPSASKIYASLSSTEFPLEGFGTITLKLKNADDQPHTVKCRLVTPESIQADRTDDEVEIMPHSEATIEYTIKNFMALQDSDFLVLAAVEYDDNMHYTTVARGRVRIGSQAERPLFYYAAALVVVLLLLYWLLRVRDEKQKKYHRKKK